MMIDGIAICLMNDEEKQEHIKACQNSIRLEIEELADAHYRDSFPEVAKLVSSLRYLSRLIAELEEE